ncbi:MAG: hypothetical protein F6J87_23885 [Spirulina sp. SIO3F2]|nr:hypothetical protein [Spirulina sp. SIO3F2]
MAQFSRTWWGQNFLAAMERFADAGRLSRGRSYAKGSKIKSLKIDGNLIVAKVRGSVNPYFGVYEEPLYTTKVDFQTISPAMWAAAIALIASKASLISRLLLNEIPDNIEDTLAQINLNLLPKSDADFQTSCSCPDWGDPCKHIAGVFYRLAAELDRDPFLLFELRGLSRDALQAELAKSPLGQALAAELLLEKQPPHPVASYHTPLQTQAVDPNLELRDFWHSAKRLPQTMEPLPNVPVSGIPVKKQGDFPGFWERDNSFIEVMETLYEQVKKKGML